MEQTNGFYKQFDKNGNEIKEMLCTYDEGERQQNEINRENAKRVFTPKFIPFYPALFKTGLTATEILIFGFLDFYLSNGTGRFYFTNEQIANVVFCSPDTVSRTISKLEKLAMIKTSRKVKSGGGQIRFIDLAKNYKSDLRISTSLSCEKLQTNKNKIKDNKINKNNTIAIANENKNFNKGFIPLKDILKEKVAISTPKYEWQELALDIIKKLKASNKGLIFKICKKYPKSFVMHALEETLELAKGDNKDRYFIKLIYKK